MVYIPDVVFTVCALSYTTCLIAYALGYTLIKCYLSRMGPRARLKLAWYLL